MQTQLHCKTFKNQNKVLWWWLNKIFIQFFLKKDENYYPQVFFKECKYTGKDKKKVIWFVSDALEISANSGRENSDNEN